MAAQPVRGLVADIEVDAVEAALLHLEVDGAGDDVARCELLARIVLGHEAGAVGQLQQPALAADGLGNQEGLGLRVVQAGRVELDELHVADPAARPPRHRYAVAGRDVGVGGVQIDLAGAAGGEHRVARGEGDDLARLDVEHIRAEAAGAGLADLVADHQVDRDVVFEDVDVRMAAHMLAERRLHRGAGGVGSMDDAAVRVSAFAGQVIAELGVRLAREGDATIDQPFDGVLAVLDHEAGRFRIAQAGTGDEGVLDVGFHAVGGVEHRGDSSLRPVARTVGELALGHEGNAQMVGEAQRHGLAGRAAAKDEYVVLFQQGVALTCRKERGGI